MHCGRKNEKRPYFIDGSKLETATKAKDLRVIKTLDLNHSEQGHGVDNKATKMSNFILRSLVVDDAGVYQNLFRTYVLPIITQCVPVRHPALKDDRSSYRKFVIDIGGESPSNAILVRTRSMKWTQKKYLLSLILRCSPQSAETTTSANTSSIKPYRKRGRTDCFARNSGRKTTPSTRFSHGV